MGGASNTRAATLTMKLPLFDTYIHIPGTNITLVLIGKDLVLEGSTTKTEDKEVPGRYTNLYLYTCTVFKSYGSYAEGMLVDFDPRNSRPYDQGL